MATRCEVCGRRLPWWSAARRLRHDLGHLQPAPTRTAATRWSLLAALDSVTGCTVPKVQT